MLHLFEMHYPHFSGLQYGNMVLRIILEYLPGQNVNNVDF